MFFNLLIGNCDAHAKNFSLLHLATGIELAPAYDLVCTRAWPELSAHLAMPVGSAKHIDAIDKEGLEGFGLEVGVGVMRQKASLIRFINHAYEALITEAPAVLDECWRNEGRVVTRAMASFEAHYRVLKAALGTAGD